MALTPAGNQVNLLAPSPTTTPGERGLPRFHAGDEVPYNARDSFARQPKPTGEAQLVPFHLILLHLPHLHHVNPEGTTLPSLQPILIDDNGTPATWTFGLVFQQATDRQDRTQQTEGRFSLLELHWRYHDSLVYRNPPPDKDSSFLR